MRLSSLRRDMAVRHIDVLLLTDTVSQRYISGFNFSDGYIVVGAQRAILLADFRYIEAAKNTVDSSFEVRLLERSRRETLVSALGDIGAVRVGYEDSSLTCAGLTRLSRELESFTLVPAGEMLARLREYKDETEISAISRAQRIAEDAFTHVLTIISPKLTEVELAAELEYHMRRAGSEEPAFPTIAISGKSTSLPHGVPQNRPLTPGFITMDFGATVDGYRSDMTRTIVLGQADCEMRRLYATVLAAQRAALDVIAPGIDCSVLDRAARDVINDAGYVGCFGHGLGHGVGLHIHEAPRVSPSGAGEFLHPGHIVTIEPGIYIEGRYGCRIEDMIAITDKGALNLTHCPKELIEL